MKARVRRTSGWRCFDGNYSCSVGSLQHNSSHTEASQLTAIALAEPHPSSLHSPSAVPPSTALCEGVSSSVLQCQSLCPPSDLRLLQRRHAVCAPPILRPVSSRCAVLCCVVSHTLSLPPASPLLLCSTQRGTVCCCTVSLALLLLSSCPRLISHFTHTQHEG